MEQNCYKVQTPRPRPGQLNQNPWWRSLYLTYLFLWVILLLLRVEKLLIFCRPYREQKQRVTQNVIFGLSLQETTFSCFVLFFSHHIHFAVRYNQVDSDQMVKGWKLHQRNYWRHGEVFHAEKKSWKGAFSCLHVFKWVKKAFSATRNQ